MMKSSIVINLERPSEILSSLPLTPIVGKKWKQLIKIGDYGNHPKYGHIEFTPNKLDAFYNNFKNNVVGREISFNYNHDGRKIAALWVQDVRKVKDENGTTLKLEYLPRYTPSGYKAIVSEEIKYVSLEYDDDFNGNGPAFTNAACTNDPFVTGEGLTELENTKKEEDIMDPKELEKLQKELNAMKDSVKKLEADNQKLQGEKKELEKKETEKKPKEQGEEVIKLQAELQKVQLEQQNYRKQLLNEKTKTFESELMQKGIPKPCITKSLEYISASENTAIKLDRQGGPEQIDLMAMCHDILTQIPSSMRVNLSQEANSGVWLDYSAGKKDEKEDPLVADATKRCERR